MYDADERKEIVKRYRELLKSWKHRRNKEEAQMVRKAFNLAVEAHNGMRRRSKEPYVYHPLEVAMICAKDMRLDATSIACALIHDVVEDTDVTLEDIERIFNPRIATIISGLTKIKDVLDDGTRSFQAEYFKQMILTLVEDMRVIMIKLADRLHNMRTLEHMSRDKQLKISSETLVLYAPLAYRMGLYNIKTELEDLSLKFTEPEVYTHIHQQVENTEKDRTRFINKFIYPIKNLLVKEDIKHQIQVRTKSVFSIWQKMQRQNISFDEVYDVFAVRIILDVPIEQERLECWKVYSLITEIYKPKHDRLRDWISIPKANGYSALHTTVMSHTGRWVEVQIRSARMHEIAESGFASHHYYKNMADEGKVIERWLNHIREQFQNQDNDALSFLDDFKLDLYSEEIYTFSPKGDMIKLPVNSSALDFAYAIHSEIGNRSIGAKVNLALVPLKHQLKSGDQVEIITSKVQKPQAEWLEFVLTSRAKSYIKESLKVEKKKFYNDGKEKLKELHEAIGVEFNRQNIKKLQDFFSIDSVVDLFYDVATGKIGLTEMKKCWKISDKSPWFMPFIPFTKSKQTTEKENHEPLAERIRNKPEEVVLGESIDTDYRIANCCNPIAGDDVIGLITPKMPILIHRANCKIAQSMMSSFGNRIVKAKWNKKDPVLFLAGIKFTGIDKIGLIFQLTEIISNKYKLKIRSFNLTSSNEVSEGKIMLYVRDTQNLNDLINEIKTIKEIKKISRMNPE
ncbi:MAG: bifunctional (p)ppGpp synthetase/guanosine-3',5'-bis(diphosphate) 3'-pyrophosphohydrolase [Bacteroidales bacterium]|nr:bifunctional (p)ppGpp synthetase/guanosine-3',5'-bis(diphosphate) 3'-pyrophosphohydrolase [Bacteroidales bacterium]